MKAYLAKKSIGFYFVLLATVAGIVSLIMYLQWAPSHKAMDVGIILPLVIGLLASVVLLVKDSNVAVIIATIGFGIAVCKLLSNSVGSFVDAFQGIKMFGDATQVGTIIRISVVIFISVLLSIIASFLKREKA